LPKLLYIGLNHGGSTTLAQSMNRHPQLSFGCRKEHQFFGGSARTMMFGPPNRNLSNRSLPSYLDEFRVPCDKTMTFDASPFYFALGNSHLGAFLRGPFLRLPGRASVVNVRNLLGHDLRMLFVVRDPVDWLNSQGVSLSHYGTDALSKTSYRRTPAERMSCFADSLETWLKFFPRDQLLVLDFATVFEDLNATLAAIYGFMGLLSHPASTSTSKELNAGRRRTASVVTSKIRHVFHNDPTNIACKQKLEYLVGMTFKWDAS
jgi:hypothetical protein